MSQIRNFFSMIKKAGDSWEDYYLLEGSKKLVNISFDSVSKTCIVSGPFQKMCMVFEDKTGMLNAFEKLTKLEKVEVDVLRELGFE